MANSALVLWLKWHVDLLPIDLLAHHATCPTNVEVAVVIEAAVAEAQEEIVVVEVAVIVAAVVGGRGLEEASVEIEEETKEAVAVVRLKTSASSETKTHHSPRSYGSRRRW